MALDYLMLRFINDDKETPMPRKLMRRTFLKSVYAAALFLPSVEAWSQVKLPKNPFNLGIASGSPTHNSVVLWTRLFDDGIFSSNIPNQDIPVKWELALDAQFTKIAKSGFINAVAALAHSVHAEVTDLSANTWFYYRFSTGGHTSRTGKTRTFVEPKNRDQERIKLAFASCQHFEHGYFNAYTHMVKENPDLVVFLGDYIYEYAPGKTGLRAHSGSWCLGLNDYRKRYAQYKAEPELQDIHAACPWITTWDDHEVQNDYAGLNPGSFGPHTDFQKRRAAAYQAYYEHMPLRASVLIEGLAGLEKGAEMRIYENYRFGNILNMSLLDTRQYRDVQACNPSGKTGSSVIDPESCETLSSEVRSILGAQQEEWLQKQLENSTDQSWTVISQTTLFGAMVYRTAEGKKVWNDGWDGYPASRKRIQDGLVKNKVANPVIFGGDVHENWVGYVKEDYANPRSNVLGYEFCGTSIATDSSKNTAGRQKVNPHFIYSEGMRRGYLVAEFTKDNLVVNLRAVIDHKAKDSDIETLASFKMVSGSKKIEMLKS